MTDCYLSVSFSFSYGLALSPIQTKQHQLKVSLMSAPNETAAVTSPTRAAWQVSGRGAGDSPSAAAPAAATTTMSFSDIMQDETRQKQSLQKLANKPLQLIQVNRAGHTA